LDNTNLHNLISWGSHNPNPFSFFTSVHVSFTDRVSAAARRISAGLPAAVTSFSRPSAESRRMSIQYQFPSRSFRFISHDHDILIQKQKN
jgi:hypothetical protein